MEQQENVIRERGERSLEIKGILVLSAIVFIVLNLIGKGFVFIVSFVGGCTGMLTNTKIFVTTMNAIVLICMLGFYMFFKIVKNSMKKEGRELEWLKAMYDVRAMIRVLAITLIPNLLLLYADVVSWNYMVAIVKSGQLYRLILA